MEDRVARRKRQSWLGVGSIDYSGDVPFEVHGMLVLVVVADVSLKDGHGVFVRSPKFLQPAVAFGRGSLKRYVGFVLISVTATHQVNHRHIVIEAQRSQNLTSAGISVQVQQGT